MLSVQSAKFHEENYYICEYQKKEDNDQHESRKAQHKYLIGRVSFADVQEVKHAANPGTDQRACCKKRLDERLPSHGLSVFRCLLLHVPVVIHSAPLNVMMKTGVYGIGQNIARTYMSKMWEFYKSGALDTEHVVPGAHFHCPACRHAVHGMGFDDCPLWHFRPDLSAAGG
uniref:hypothetical protein n=1 Tax=Agrobacterium tumefaciens TaxID=358 RepID=UPI00163AEE70|nr:hypothetical protein [Agrobacterium tumefaciens]